VWQVEVNEKESGDRKGTKFRLGERITKPKGRTDVRIGESIV
jgi:hypothetical protein